MCRNETQENTDNTQKTHIQSYSVCKRTSHTQQSKKKNGKHWYSFVIINASGSASCMYPFPFPFPFPSLPTWNLFIGNLNVSSCIGQTYTDFPISTLPTQWWLRFHDSTLYFIFDIVTDLRRACVQFSVHEQMSANRPSRIYMMRKNQKCFKEQQNKRWK